MERIVQQCRDTNSTIGKQEVLEECAKICPELKELLYRAYEPFLRYHMMSAIHIDDFGSRGAVEAWSDFKNLLDIMASRQTPTKNKDMLEQFLNGCNPYTQTLFLGVVRKNLKLGFGVSLINKAFPNLITVFDVMLAKRYDPNKKYATKTWKMSAKMDGLRLVALYGFQSPGWKIYTRTGKDITNRMPHLLPDLEKFRLKYHFTFLDGEAYVHGATFEELQGGVLRHDGDDCSWIEYHTFAFGDVKSFLSQNCTGILIPSSDAIRVGNIVTVPHFSIPNDNKRMEQFALKMESSKYEGAMCRNPAVPYPKGRTFNLLKIKSWLLDSTQQDLSVKCVNIEGSLQKRADTILGEMTEVFTLKSIAIEDPDTGIITHIGTGFTYTQRDEIWENRDNYTGKMLDIKYQKTGAKGRKIFPVFCRWRFDLENLQEDL